MPINYRFRKISPSDIFSWIEVNGRRVYFKFSYHPGLGSVALAGVSNNQKTRYSGYMPSQDELNVLLKSVCGEHQKVEVYFENLPYFGGLPSCGPRRIVFMITKPLEDDQYTKLVKGIKDLVRDHYHQV